MDENWKRELFLDRRFEANTFKVNGAGVKSSIDDINYFDIIDIHVNKRDYSHLKFLDRIELLKKENGWIHLASGASFGIEKGTVVQLKLSTRYLQDNKITRIDLIKIFGQPDNELVDDILYSGLDYSVDHNILVFRKKKIYAFLDPVTDTLKELHFGEFEEGIYGKKQ